MTDNSADAFHAAMGAGDFTFVRHNEVDYAAYREAQKAIDERFRVYEQKRSRDERLSNLLKWDEQLPERWRGAKLTQVRNPAAQEALTLMASKGPGSFFLQGDSGSGKTYIAYAIIRRYIGVGWVTPAQIKVIPEERLLSYAFTGFEGRKKMDQLLDPRYSLYLIDGVGSRGNYSPKEIELIEQIVAHIYSNSLMGIFTSNRSVRGLTVLLSDSGASRFGHLVSGKILEVGGTRDPVALPVTDEELKDYQEVQDEGRKLNAFKG
jgi:DNA replication protein DnaC